MIITTDSYDWLAFVLSSLGVVFALMYLNRSIRAYRMFHDESAAVGLGVAVGFMVINFGMMLSAFGLMVGIGELSLMGVSIARGAIVTLVGTLLLVDIRPSADRFR